MKELDVVLTAYLERFYDNAPAADQQCFNDLLEMPDPDLYALILGRMSSESDTMEKLVLELRNLKKMPSQ